MRRECPRLPARLLNRLLVERAADRAEHRGDDPEAHHACSLKWWSIGPTGRCACGGPERWKTNRFTFAGTANSGSRRSYRTSESTYSSLREGSYSAGAVRDVRHGIALATLC